VQPDQKDNFVEVNDFLFSYYKIKLVLIIID